MHFYSEQDLRHSLALKCRWSFPVDGVMYNVMNNVMYYVMNSMSSCSSLFVAFGFSGVCIVRCVSSSIENSFVFYVHRARVKNTSH